MRYFDHCTTADELKKAYHRAAMENHPDQGGSDEAMKEVNRQYEEAAARIEKKGNTAKDNGSTEDAGQFDPIAFRRAVMAAVKYPDITLELVGRWLWATGNTFKHKDELKAAGFRWSHSHKAWYYRDDADATGKGGNKTLDEIKDKYGSERIISTGWTRATLTA